VIDPGHGGTTAAGGSSPSRAIGPNGLLEKDLTLDLARRVRSLLSPQVRVVLTRDEDRNLSLSRRAGIARENDAAVFLSLHFDGAADSSVDRTQAWIARDASKSTRHLAESVTKAVAGVAGTVAALPVERNLGVLLTERHSPHTSACLLEIAYLTNRDEALRLERDSYRQDVASAIAGAVHLHLSQPTSGALDTPKTIDEALDNKQAMIYSPKAPRDDVESSKDIRADERAIWTYCPRNFKIGEPEVLVFFHGHRQFVAATLAADGTIVPRKPHWAPKSVTKANAGVNYGFDKTDGLLHQPIEMLPEVGVASSSADTWCTEPAGKLVKPAALGEMIDNTLERLSQLDKPSGRVKYLSKKIETKDLQRLFLFGHSGGTAPLAASARSTVANTIPTDLAEFDSTFGVEDVTPYVDFCKSWDAKGKLGNGEKSSRFFAFYGAGSPYMGPSGDPLGKKGNTLLHKLTADVKAGGLGFSCNKDPILSMPDVWPDTNVIYIQHKTDHPATGKWSSTDKATRKWIELTEEKPPGSSNLDLIRAAFKKNYKAVFVYTNVTHEFIPLAFTPLILEYKRNP
jgi:hypothetical protein